jgi:RNA polymerase sigma-70 factor (ECF subfamily)
MVLPATNSLLSLRLKADQVVEKGSAHEPVASGISSLTRRLAAGEEAAFEEFHAAYFDRLYHFLLLVTRGQEDEAGDALQHTFLRVLRYARVFESEDTFWCWLKVVARSAARDGGRKRQRYLAVLHRFALWWSGRELEQAANSDERLRAMLEESLCELVPQDRQLIEGKYLDETTIRELSRQTGLTEKAVESRLLRLRRQLRERILKEINSP